MKKVAKKLLSRSLHSAKLTRWFIGSLLLMLTLTAASCTREQPNSQNKISDGEVSVTLNMDIPYSSSAQTRAIGVIEENTIESIYVLAFEVKSNGDEVFEYHSIAKVAAGSTPGSSTQKFTTKVRLKSYAQRFVIIANGETQVEALLLNNWVGGLKDDMLKTLTVSLANAGDQWNTANAGYTKFPMWGESNQTTITEGSTSLGTSISMFRMIAKIDVRLNPAIQNANLFNEFKLASVHLYNTSQSGRVAPSTAAGDWDLTTTPGEPFVINPSMPEGWTDANRIEGPLAYTDFGAPGVADRSMVGAIYTFEIPTDGVVATKRPCLVVGGHYYDATTSSFDTDQSYYRLDFIKKDDGAFMPILRNHRYEFNIINVKGRGYPTPDEAFKALPINMEVEVIKWNESGMNNAVSDGQYFLSVSKDEFKFFRDAQTVEGEDNVLYVMTDYATTALGAKSGWYVDKIVDAADGTTVVNWLTLTPDNNVNPNIKTKVVMSFGENTGADRTAIIWISAGRMRFAVKATQTNTPEMRVKIVNPATNVELTELLFASAVDVAPTPQSFRVNWAPKSADLTVNTTPIGTNAFPTGAGAITPALGNVPGGNNGTGTITYNVSPPALTAAETDPITGDPFMEKVSKVDFTTTNGISYESKSIFLRQINFNLLTDIAPDYFLASQPETIKVRANFPWTITGVSDTSDILQNENSLVGKTGGNNTTPGDDLSFTMSPGTSDDSKEGKTATITITNLIDNKTWTITITATESFYVGYFGGELKSTAGVWQFERKLYVQRSDESTGITWGPDALVGASSKWDGKGTTFNLRAATYPATNLCFTKNANHASITGVGDANYVWYLPAQNQLMAAWGAHTSFFLPFGSAYYWTTTEFNPITSMFVNFTNGETDTSRKPDTINRVRCVREVTP